MKHDEPVPWKLLLSTVGGGVTTKLFTLYLTVEFFKTDVLCKKNACKRGLAEFHEVFYIINKV